MFMQATGSCSDVERLIGAAARGIALALPWLFIATLVALYRWLLWPAVEAGHLLALGFGVLALIALTSFVLAAISLTADFIKGLLP